MKKTLFILIVVALLGILAATVVPSAQQRSTASATTTTVATSTPTSSTVAATATPTSTTTTTNSGQYKDGKYTGTTASNYYDDIQVAVVISGGKITSISTPTLSGDSSRSEEINSYAIPELKNQAISAQSASIDGVSGASYTSQAYEDSLQSALDQAKA